MTPRTARGMRDFLPKAALRRQRVMSTLRGVFERYGFEPLETPAVENLETLLGKYGEEGDALIFRILKRGEGAERGEADLGLRYDLTVPLARVVAQHRSDLALPLRRYQMQPVWRADRPAKGRFREFYQCDVDVVGSASLVADAEILALVHDGLVALGFDAFTILLNDRRILRAIVEVAAVPLEREAEVLVALDKLDKIGADGVVAEWKEGGLDAVTVDAHLRPLLELAGGAGDVLDGLRARLAGHEVGRRAVDELAQLRSLALELGVDGARLVLAPRLARGLSYYTGPIFETVVSGMPGSVTGGGRYDRLVAQLGGPDLPATGTSFGLERLIALIEEREGPEGAPAAASLYVALPWPETVGQTLALARDLRRRGHSVLVAADVGGKLLAHFQQAERRGIGLVAFIGPEEAAAGSVVLRDVKLRQQSVVGLDEIAARLGRE